MTFQSKIIYPKEEEQKENRLTELMHNEYGEELTREDIITQYEGLLVKGFSVNATFQPPKLENAGEEEADIFEIAQQLELAGIPYKANLKLQASGEYEFISKIAKLVEQQDFDYRVTADLTINEDSTIDFEKESSWFDPEFAKYKLIPKASSQDINDLKTLYDELKKEHCKVSIDIKAKVKKDDDENFVNQFTAYPDGTLVTFKLSDADVYSD
ncbi:hypothetical protein [Lactococcus lactis]|uniref:hypothetical protein n=1 Tax=Lactococcus lactis TaxID=1358 RepID=UPI001912644A|nr:hypothetical protein [Lactococcus lactis]WDA67448.1 hypothetical protein IL310_01395 [Lactococcus lactis]WDA67481.1 hypothetical protein IL310_00980 [Lactococcus lactis]